MGLRRVSGAVLSFFPVSSQSIFATKYRNPSCSGYDEIQRLACFRQAQAPCTQHADRDWPRWMVKPGILAQGTRLRLPGARNPCQRPRSGHDFRGFRTCGNGVPRHYLLRAGKARHADPPHDYRPMTHMQPIDDDGQTLGAQRIRKRKRLPQAARLSATLGREKEKALTTQGFFAHLGGGGRNRTGVHGFAGRCMTTLPPRQGLN